MAWSGPGRLHREGLPDWVLQSSNFIQMTRERHEQEVAGRRPV